VRGGGIGQRPVLQPLAQDVPWSGLYQGGMLYQPDYADPHLLLLIGGRLYRVRVDTDNRIDDLSATYGHTMPATEQEAFFSQAEMFAVIQAGDYSTLPLFYDFGDGIRAESLRRSLGVTNPGVSDVNNEIPAAGPMADYAQRLWYAYSRGYAAGDISGSTFSGTPGFAYRDSVLKLTENPIAYGGDGFAVPTVAGRIRALAHASNLDTALGESQLFVFTRRSIYACVAPVTRDDWTASDNDQQPLQKVVLNRGGSYSGRAVVPVNGDLFFPSPPNGDVRSVQTSLRYFGQWGNVPLSTNISRATAFNDRSMLSLSSGIQFENRMLLTALPTACTAGTGFQAILPLNFDTISTFEERKPPAWEGVYDFSGGPYILQMFEGDFGGRERAFAVVWSVAREQIEVWEIRGDLRFENGENRVTRVIEFPAYSFGNPFGLKELDTAEIWLDKILGGTDIEVYYRPDGYSCWVKWWAFQKSAAKDCRDDTVSPCADDGYPVETWCEQDAIPVMIPKPVFPPCIPGNNRPANWGYQFQVRLVIKGWARVRGFLVHALWREKKPYEGLACQTPSTRL
ncbi:MAG: hypothetical protein KKD77_20190, partial [Gammaproteobacteria bacterium]|nr:hypothetical protein [Gammaproteobacteria bacterium]